MTPDQLQVHFKTCSGKNVLLIGEAIQDVNVYGKILGVSAETPTLVMEEASQTISLGGAGCVWRNLETLGATVDFLSPTIIPRKTRYWVDGYKLFQVDSFPKEFEQAEIYGLYLKAEWSDVVVVADYRHGFITEPFAKAVAQIKTKPLFISSQVSQSVSNHHWYKSSETVFVGNEKEGAYFKDLATTGVITAGPLGARIYPLPTYEKAIPVTPADTCGAGDAFLAAYALTASLEFSNLWAGLSCLVKGANPPTIADAVKWVEDHQ